MTTIIQNIADITGATDDTAWVFYTKELRGDSSGAAIVTTKKVRKYPVDGVLTVTLDPGPAVVIAADGSHYRFTVPESDSELWPLIQAAVQIPPATTHEELEAAVASWLAGQVFETVDSEIATQVPPAVTAEVAVQVPPAVTAEINTQLPGFAEPVVADEVAVQVPPAVSAQVAAQVPPAVDSEVTDTVPPAVTADIQSRNLTAVDLGNSTVQFKLGGVNMGAPYTLPGAAWSTLAGKPAVIAAGADQAAARAAVSAATTSGSPNATLEPSIAPVWGQSAGNYTIGGGASWTNDTTLAIVNGSTLSFNVNVTTDEVYQFNPTFSAPLSTGVWTVVFGSNNGFQNMPYWQSTSGEVGFVAQSTGSITISATFTSLGSLNITGISVRKVTRRSAQVVGGVEARSTSTSDSNTAAGYQALSENTTGYNNTATGYRALRSNTTGGNNTAYGYQALQYNTTGNANTAAGYRTLESNTTGSENTVVGFQALRYNTTGNANTAAGNQALESNTTGGSNTAYGHRALQSNTTGAGNTAAGQQALRSNTTGGNNTAAGYLALSAPAGNASNATTTGSRQTAVGQETGQSSATQLNDITTIGYRALAGADNATAVGSTARADHAASVALGSGTTTTASNQVMVGGRDVEITDATKGIVMKSPDGTRYRIKVANGGTLTVTPA